MRIKVLLLCVLSAFSIFVSVGLTSEIRYNDVQDEAQSFVYELRTSQNDFATAFAVHPSGVFMTCAHLLEKKQTLDFEIVLISREKEIIPVKILFVVEQLDVMALVAKKEGNYPAVSWDLSEQYPLGDSFYTCGNNKGEMTSGFGILFAIQNEMKSIAFPNVMLLNIPIVPGYSGSPLFNKDGKVSGMILGNNKENPSITYAISSNYLIKECMKIVNSGNCYGLKPDWGTVLENKTLTAIGEWEVKDEVGVWLSDLIWVKDLSKKSMNVIVKDKDGNSERVEVPILEKCISPLPVLETELQHGVQISVRDLKTGNVLLNGHSRNINGVCFFPNSILTIKGFWKIPVEGAYSFFLPQLNKGELKINNEIFIKKNTNWQINARQYGYFKKGFYSFELNIFLADIPKGPCLGFERLGSASSSVIPDEWLFSDLP